MAHKQSCGGDGGDDGSVGYSSLATALFPHQQTACNPIGWSFSDGAIMPRWNWQVRPHQQQQEKLEQEQQSHLNIPQLLQPIRQSQDIREQTAHQADEFQDSFEGVPMQPSAMSSEPAPQEYLHKDKIQSLQDEYLKWAFLDAQRNASQSVHLNNFCVHDVSQLSPQLSMFGNSPGHFLQIETQTNLQDASRSSLLKSPQTQMTPLVGNNIEKLLDIQNCYKLKNNMPSQLMNTTQSQDLRVYSALEQDINVKASLSIPDIQANLATRHKVPDRNITEKQSNRLQIGQNISSSSHVQNYAMYSNSVASGMPESFPHVGNLALVDYQFVPEAGDCELKNTWLGCNKPFDAYDNTITSFGYHLLPSPDLSPKEVISFGNNLPQGTPEMQSFSHSEQLNQIPISLVNRNRAVQFSHCVKIHHQGYGFTNQQLNVLWAQILVFKQLKHGQTLPPDVLGHIGPPPLTQHEDQVVSEILSTGKLKHCRELTNALNNGTKVQILVAAKTDPESLLLFEEPRNVTAQKLSYAQLRMHLDRSQIMLNRKNAEKLSVNCGEKKKMLGMAFSGNGHEEEEIGNVQLRTKENVPAVTKLDTVRGNNSDMGENKFIMSKFSSIAVPDQTENFTRPPIEIHPMNSNNVRKYVGPLFDFPQCRGKDESVPISTHVYSPFTLGYDIKELLSEEGFRAFEKRRADKLRKVNYLLEMKRNGWQIRVEFVRKLQIVERMLRLLDVQKHLRDEIDRQQQQIMMMSDRTYFKFVHFCKRIRTKLARNVAVSRKAIHEKQLKEAFQGRKKFLETSSKCRDARYIRNRGLAKYHERMLKDYSKMMDKDQNERMQALKNNDLDHYCEILEQQTQLSGNVRDCYKPQLPDKDINGQYMEDECQEDFKTSAEEKDALSVGKEERQSVDYIDKEDPSDEAVFKETRINCVYKESQRKKSLAMKCSSWGANDKFLLFGEDLKDGEDILSEVSSQYEKSNAGYVSCRPASSQKFISFAAFEVKPDSHQLKVYEKAPDSAGRVVLPTKIKRKRCGSHCRRWSAVKLRPYFYGKLNDNLSWRSIHCGFHTVLNQKEISIREPLNNGSDECDVNLIEQQHFTCEDKLLDGHTVCQSCCMDESHELNGPLELAESSSCAGEMLLCLNSQKDARQQAASFSELFEWYKNPGWSRVITNSIIAQLIMQQLDHYEYMQAEVTRSQELFSQQMAHNFPDLNISSIKFQSPYAHSHSSPLSAPYAHSHSSSFSEQLQGRSRKQDYNLVSDSGYLKPFESTFDYNDLSGTDGQKAIMPEKRMERKASEAGEVPSTTLLVTGKMTQQHLGEEEINAQIFPKVHSTSDSLVGLSFDCPCQVSYCKKRQISELESLCPFQWPIHSKKPRTGIGHRRHSFQ